MKVQIISDIHLELYDNSFRNFEEIIKPKCNILFMVGDIGNIYNNNYKPFLTYISDNWKEIYYVLGNHEYYQTKNNINYCITKEELDTLYDDLILEYWNIYLITQYDNYIYHIYDDITNNLYIIMGNTMWSYLKYDINNTCINDTNNIYTYPLTFTKLKQLDNPITQLDNPITQLDNPITQLDDPITQLDNPITQLDNPITQLDVPITQLDDRMTQLGKKNNYYNENYVKIDINVINNDLTINKDLFSNFEDTYICICIYKLYEDINKLDKDIKLLCYEIDRLYSIILNTKLYKYYKDNILNFAINIHTKIYLHKNILELKFNIYINLIKIINLNNCEKFIYSSTFTNLMYFKYQIIDLYNENINFKNEITKLNYKIIKLYFNEYLDNIDNQINEIDINLNTIKENKKYLLNNKSVNLDVNENVKTNILQNYKKKLQSLLKLDKNYLKCPLDLNIINNELLLTKNRLDTLLSNKYRDNYIIINNYPYTNYIFEIEFLKHKKKILYSIIKNINDNSKHINNKNSNKQPFVQILHKYKFELLKSPISLLYNPIDTLYNKKENIYSTKKHNCNNINISITNTKNNMLCNEIMKLNNNIKKLNYQLMNYETNNIHKSHITNNFLIIEKILKCTITLLINLNVIINIFNADNFVLNNIKDLNKYTYITNYTINIIENNNIILKNEITELYTQLDNPITQLDNPITQLDNPITQLDNPIIQLDDPITQLDNPITHLDIPITQLDDRITQLDDRITHLDIPITQLDDRITQLDDRITHLDDKDTQLDKIKDKLKTKIKINEKWFLKNHFECLNNLKLYNLDINSSKWDKIENIESQYEGKVKDIKFICLTHFPIADYYKVSNNKFWIQSDNIKNYFCNSYQKYKKYLEFYDIFIAGHTHFSYDYNIINNGKIIRFISNQKGYNDNNDNNDNINFKKNCIFNI